MEKTIRQISLENLPKNKRNQINWKECVGYKVKFIYDDIEGWIEILNYELKTEKLTIKYKDKIFEIRTGHFKRCKIGKLLNKKTSNFKIEIGTRFKDDKRDITIIDRKYEKDNLGRNQKLYKYKCNRCGFNGEQHYNIKEKQFKNELWVREGSLLQGDGCSCCCSSPQIIVNGINDILTTNLEMFYYLKNRDEGYINTCSSGKSIWFKCLDCGFEKKMKINTFNKYGLCCPNCSDEISYPNKFMHNLLQQLEIEYDSEKYFK